MNFPSALDGGFDELPAIFSSWGGLINFLLSSVDGIIDDLPAILSGWGL